MISLETPQFSNSCGKIFTDKIILATAHRESEVAVKDIKKISFTGRPQPKGLFFVALPVMLLAFPFITNEKDWFVNGIFIILGVLLTGFSLTQLSKVYTLNVKLNDGNTINIKVWEGNQKEAKKFVSMVKAKIARRA